MDTFTQIIKKIIINSHASEASGCALVNPALCHNYPKPMVVDQFYESHSLAAAYKACLLTSGKSINTVTN